MFCAGLASRRYEAEHEYHAAVHRGAQRMERFLTVVVLVVLGSVLTLKALSTPGVDGWILAGVVILAIRAATSLPVLARDSSLGWHGRAFVAWFGVRGVAAVYYATAILRRPLRNARPRAPA